MARQMRNEDQDAYRAVITRTWPPTERLPEGRTITRIYGPYTVPTAAQAAITRAERRAASYSDHTVAGRVQRATGWEDVPAAGDKGGR